MLGLGGALTPPLRAVGGAQTPSYWGWGATDPTLQVVGGHRPSSWEGALTLLLGLGPQTPIWGGH